MTLDTLHSLYVHELQDLYSAETQLVKALPKLAKAATSADLKTAFKTHLEQTKEHVQRLEQILAALGQTPGSQKCKGMAGLIKEGQDLIKAGKNGADSAVLDGGLITAAQKVEHYEIAGYGSARTYAQMLREDRAADLLQQTLNEEGQTDERLTELAEATLSVAPHSQRLTDLDLSGDVTPAAAGSALSAVNDEDTETYKGATEEMDNDLPRTWQDESGGLGARTQPDEERQDYPMSGD
jgi:ferritin-like metal-binding protein YciE